MTMKHCKEELVRFGDEDLAEIVKDVHDVFKERHPGMEDILLPQRGESSSRRVRGLGPGRHAIEISTISEELYSQTREAVEQAGYNFVVSIRPVSIGDLIEEDGQREQRGEQRRFGYVDTSKNMRAFVPKEVEVAINPTKFKILGSNGLSTDEQKEKIRQEQEKLRRQLPSDIRRFIKMEMVDPSTLSQLEDAYMDKTGRLLLPDFGVRTDVRTFFRAQVACVGRSFPTSGRFVTASRRDLDIGHVFAASVVVLPMKLAS